MDTSLILAAACLALLLALVLLAWLHWRPRVYVVWPGPAPTDAPPPPTHIKCNVRHYVFQRTNPETQEIEQQDVYRHPYCEGLPLDFLTDEIQSSNFLGGRAGEGWRHTETRGEMHMVKA